MSTGDPWWALVRQCLESGDWPAAEGALLRLLREGPAQANVLDLLAYAQLMQGEYVRSEGVLRQALATGTRSFWTPHKLGDALRGQQRFGEAIQAYGQALDWGSDSPLTLRNLLEVEYRLAAERALARLRGCLAAPGLPAGHNWNAPPPWLLGAIEASLRVAGPELAELLCAHGCPLPAVRRVAWQETLARLDLAATLALLANAGDGDEDGEGRCLRERLHTLLP
jgi:tetratricopeptide (TPR) repeat protein